MPQYFSTRKMRSFRLPLTTRMKLSQLHLNTGKDQTALIIEGINLLWEKYGIRKFEETQKEEKTETA